MSDIKKIKDEYLNKLKKDQSLENINQIKTELFGKNGIISNEFKKYDIKFTKVYSSYWCRCYETVKSMGLKKYELHSGLNSFYQNYANKKEVLKDLKDLISSLDKKQGPYLFVTHYVVIGSYTKIFPDSGGIVVHDLNYKSNHELQLF